jgi:2-polyprenyl-3-methyl-5-hydroxy-6-metoxy-1,4-benzoquinol methylase
MTHDADDYRTLNRLSWDERAPAHAASPGYNLDAFRRDPEHLSDVVRFDLPLLGDISGLRGVHLQCHIGTDTISLARLGARMTGLDFSPAAVAQATQLSEELGAGVDFVEADVYDAADVLPAGEFDLVFTGIGARSAGSPASAGGPRWWRPCSSRVAGSSSARATR